MSRSPPNSIDDLDVQGGAEEHRKHDQKEAVKRKAEFEKSLKGLGFKSSERRTSIERIEAKFKKNEGFGFYNNRNWREIQATIERQKVMQALEKEPVRQSRLINKWDLSNKYLNVKELQTVVQGRLTMIANTEKTIVGFVEASGVNETVENEWIDMFEWIQSVENWTRLMEDDIWYCIDAVQAYLFIDFKQRLGNPSSFRLYLESDEITPEKVLDKMGLSKGPRLRRPPANSVTPPQRRATASINPPTVLRPPRSRTAPQQSTTGSTSEQKERNRIVDGARRFFRRGDSTSSSLTHSRRHLSPRQLVLYGGGFE
ncbi:uncharacterized protein JCM6883_005748 [Sporobolomyces salmoneus]|uniref:uncharacterized protein n=1 Tax=Sporobolomyces salmoneus TaxID=183962 RepID=UPI00317A4E94